MRIEIIEKGGFRIGRDHYAEGDVRTVDDDDGSMYCALGWAKDTSGKVPTGDRVPGKSLLEVSSIKHKITGII